MEGQVATENISILRFENAFNGCKFGHFWLFVLLMRIMKELQLLGAKFLKAPTGLCP